MFFLKANIQFPILSGIRRSGRVANLKVLFFFSPL